MKIAVASGKGGTGKTFLSTNLFYAIRGEGCTPTLLDCDAEGPNARLFFKGRNARVKKVVLKVPEIIRQHCNFCGKCQEYCRFNAIFILPPSRLIRILEEFCHGCGACVLACPCSAIREVDLPVGRISRVVFADGSSLVESRMDIGIHSPVKVIREGIQETERDSPLIMDAPPGTACPFIQTVAMADYVVLVTEPTPFGLSDLKQSVGVLKSMNKTFGVVINRSGMGSDAVGHYLADESIPLLMNIAFDPSIAATYARGKLYAALNKQWRSQLLDMFGQIRSYVGNSHH